MDYLSFIQHIAAVRRNQAQTFRALCAYGQFRGRKRNGKAQRQFQRADAALRLLLILQNQRKAVGFKITQGAVQKRAAHQHKPSVISRAAFALLVFNGNAILPVAQTFGLEGDVVHEHRQETLILTGEAHHTWTIGKFFGQAEVCAQRVAGEQVGNALDRIQPFLTGGQTKPHASVAIQTQRGLQTDGLAAGHGAAQGHQHLFAQRQLVFLLHVYKTAVLPRLQNGRNGMRA